MKSALCALACVWFVFAAVTLTVPPGAIQTAGDETPAVLADIGRMLFVGLAILAAAGIDWNAVGRRLGPLLDQTNVRPSR